MATQTKVQSGTQKPNEVAKVETEAVKESKSLAAFWTKFSNDWSFNLAAALAYNLLMSIFPIALALLSILGLIVGTLNHATYAQLVQTITTKLPSTVAVPIQSQLSKQQSQLAVESTILGIISIILAVFNGSRLFVLIEGCFGIIYRARQRAFIQQNLMAFGMLLLFIILIPIMAAGSVIPSFAVQIVKALFDSFPGSIVLVTVVGIVGSLIPSYILFQSIYLVVPNQKISFKHSWRGSLVAAILLQLYLTLFPLYVSHFLTGYASSISSVIILLIFFYYFAMILLLGAEVNAFFGEGIRNSPADVVTLVKDAASGQLPAGTTVQHNGTDSKAVQSAAARTLQGASAALSTKGSYAGTHEKKDKQRDKAAGSSRGSVMIAVAAGTVMAFLTEWFRIRKKE